MSFLSDLLLPTPALEAEDITGEVQQQTANALGGSDNMGAQNDRDLSLNTDDILGIKEDPDGGVDDDTSTTQEDNLEGIPTDDEGTTGDLINNDSTMNPEEPEENPLDSKNDEFERTRKKKLWSNFKELYTILDNSIELISKFVPNVSDVATIKTLDDIKDNLVDAKDVAYSTMTAEYQALNYPQMQKRYIALNNIYDIITKELETYFDKYHDAK